MISVLCMGVWSMAVNHMKKRGSLGGSFRGSE